MLNGTSYLGLVHGDACPDNVRLIDGACRIVHSEAWGWGLAASAPPIFWRRSRAADFASPPTSPARPLTPTGPGFRPRVSTWDRDWEHLTTAVLAGLIIACGHVIAEALGQDHEWEQPRRGPGCWPGRRISPAAPVTAPCPRFRPPPAPRVISPRSAGQDLAYPITQRSRRPTHE